MSDSERPTRAVGGPGGRAARGARSRAGFTLVELVAVMLMVGVMALVAVPALSNLGTQRAAAAAREVWRDVIYARARALASGTNTWVVFSVAGQSYSVLSESVTTPGRAGATTMNDPVTGAGLVRGLGRNETAGIGLVSVSFGGGAEVGFDRLGRPLTTAGALATVEGTVVLTDSWTVGVVPRTGSVWVRRVP